MPSKPENTQPFNIVVIGQDGRLMYEALLFAASLRAMDPGFSGRLFVAEPQPGERWSSDPRMKNIELLAALKRLDAEILPFESHHFGQSYPYGNKIEALMALPEGEPFVFFDTDTLITGPVSGIPFDFSKPCASLKVEGTWPQLELYGPGYGEIWKSLYDKFGLDFESSLDLDQPDEYWKRYLYFNAGFFFYECPRVFGQKFLDYGLAIRDDPPQAAALQTYDPWLDQVALPLVIHAWGGARRTIPEDTLDGAISCHYRTFPLLFAREGDHVVEVLREVTKPNWIKKVLKEYDPIKRLVFQPKGEKIREMFDRDHLPRREQMIRNKIKKAGYWMR